MATGAVLAKSASAEPAVVTSNWTSHGAAKAAGFDDGSTDAKAGISDGKKESNGGDSVAMGELNAKVERVAQETQRMLDVQRP